MAGYVNSIMNWITGSGPGEPSSPSGSGEPSSSRSRVKLGLALPDELLMLGQELEQVTIHLGLNTKDLDDSKAAHMTGIMQKYKMWQLCQRQRPPGKPTAQDLLRGLEDLLRGLEDLEDVPFGTRLPLREGAERFIPQWHKDPEESGIETMSDSDSGSVSSGCESMSEYELSVDRTMLDGDNKTRSAGRDMSDEQLLKVAETLGQEWEQAAIHLDLKNEDLDEIMAEERHLTLRKYKMLQLWKNRRPGKATAQDLLRGLEDMEDLPVETHLLLIGLEKNRSKPVKKKPSCSSGQGSRPGELSSSPPLKMPASDGTLDDEDVKDDEEEMHFKSHREKCEAAQQSPEYEKVTPRKISKWRFQVQLECEGTYECSVTGLVFEDSDIKAIEEPVNKDRKKCIRIYKPAACRLEEKAYHLTSEPERKIEPLAQATSSPPVPSSATQSAEGELKRIFCIFIDRVSISLIKSLVDELWQKKMLTTDEKDSVIQNQTNRKDQARCLIHSVMAKGERTSQMMIDFMKKTDPELCITLDLISTPAAGVAEILQTRF